MKLDLNTLTTAIGTAAAIRRIRRLQPIGGLGDKIFPPTYPADNEKGDKETPQHVLERRRVDGEDVWCVLIDSVQSQANRMEEALLAAATDPERSPGIALPYVTVDFEGTGLEPLRRITSLEAHHRVYDGLLRDSRIGNERFMQSGPGRRLGLANTTDASAVLELSPNALLFGAWHSQGEGGGVGAKFARILVSEIMGINVPVDEVVANARTGETRVQTAGKRATSRGDMLGILKKVEIYKGTSVQDWSPDKTSAGPGAKKVPPAKINHGRIKPSVTPLGVTFDYAEHRVTVTLAGARRLGFGSPARDRAGRAYIIALGLLAIAEQEVQGYPLRSRCDLVCEGPSSIELVHADGTIEALEIDRETATEIYLGATAQAVDAGFRFESLTLVPQDKLVHIMQESRERTLAGEAEDEEADADETA